jgi:6-phosphogluconolactonase
MEDHTDLVFLGSLAEAAGITAVRRDQRTGDLRSLGLVAETPAPSFLARHPSLPVLYAVNSLPEGRLSAWEVGSEGQLRPLASVSTGGANPCHVATAGEYVVSANYGGGSVAVHRLDGAGVPGERTDLAAHTGSGPHPDRQREPHPHMVGDDPAGTRVSAVDLGADAVFHYRLDGGQLLPDDVTHTRPGTGPRHFARHNGLCYLVGELDGTITCYEVDSGWRERDQLPICSDGASGYASEVAVSTSGRHVYTASRGPDRIAVFAETGRLQPVAEVPCGGHWPRHIALIGDHLYVANERSDTVVTFRVDPATGVPAPSGNAIEATSPSCVLPYTLRSDGTPQGH